MENRNQHMQHAKSGAMRGVAAQPALQQHVTLRHASAPGKQKRVKDKKQKSTQKRSQAKCTAWRRHLKWQKAFELCIVMQVEDRERERERHLPYLPVCVCLLFV